MFHFLYLLRVSRKRKLEGKKVEPLEINHLEDAPDEEEEAFTNTAPAERGI